MKTIIILLSILSMFFGCQTNTRRMAGKPCSISDALSTALTDEQQKVIKSVLAKNDSLRTKTHSPGFLSDNITAITGKEITYLPFYYLNTDKFYEHPVPENLFKSLEQPQDSMYFFVKENNEILFTLLARREKGQWVTGGIIGGKNPSQRYGIEPTPLPVEELLKNPQRTAWKVFKCWHYTYFTYCLEGERFYYSIIDNKNMSPTEACEDLYSFIKHQKEVQARGEEYY